MKRMDPFGGHTPGSVPPESANVQCVNLLIELLLEVSRHNPEEFEEFAHGATLGVKDYTIKSKLRDYA